jgi:hypothetical protein
MPLFTVPKFTEMETKLVGPLTFKQFVFILGTAAICFLVYRLVPHFLSLPLVIIIAALGFALAFLKIGEIPFYQMFLDGLKFLATPRILFWGKKGKREITPWKEMEIKKEEKGQLKIKKESELKNLLVKVETKK